MNNNKGFTLIELLVTMTLVIAVLIITGSAFESILKSTGRLVASEESNIEGVIGLEMFRHDLQQAGFGLPHAFVTAPKYGEASVAPANLLNDGKGGTSSSLDGNVPRAVASMESLTGYTTVLSGTDYLAIKATTVGRTNASQRWTFLTYTASTSTTVFGRVPNKWLNSSDNFKSTDRVIVLNRSFATGGSVTNTLVNNSSTPLTYWATSADDTLADAALVPTRLNDVYYLYGITDSGGPRMPFNRSDYFVMRPSDTTQIPTKCAPDTGILYKANVNHSASSNTSSSGGTLNYLPLLDCVADLQVVFGWDINGNGQIDESTAYDSASPPTTMAVIPIPPKSTAASVAEIKAIMESPEEIRNKLKYIKVYIMVQDGRKDANYSNTNSLLSNSLAVVVGDATASSSNVTVSRGYTAAQLTAKGWQNYRWKVYRIVVRPKNLTSS
jgi:type II secretory pathway pseudopilin PulG